MSTKQELRKALDTSATNGGNALLPYDLEPTLNEELLKLQPLAQLLPVINAGGKTHEFTLRTAHPSAWFEGEATGANVKTSTYSRKSTMLKIQRIWGSVTGFAQTFDEPFIDALTAELEGSLEGMANLFEFGALWGCANDLGFTGDPYQYSGLFANLAKASTPPVIDAGSAKVTLDMLDQAVAKVAAYRQTRTDPFMWVMGLRMRQIVDGLQSKVQMPLTSTVLNDGRYTMANYFGHPIFESDYVVPAGTSTSPAATGAQGDNAEGTLAAATYTYQIASVTAFGEQIPGTASAGIVADVTHLHVHLTWTHDDNALSYMIFRKKDAGAYALLDIIPAITYNADGSIAGNAEAYVDKGDKTPIASIKPLATGEQNIFLVNRHPERGAGFLAKVDDMGRPIDRMVSYVELARTKDTYDYMLKGYLGFRVKYPDVACAVIRHVKLS